MTQPHPLGEHATNTCITPDCKTRLETLHEYQEAQKSHPNPLHRFLEEEVTEVDSELRKGFNAVRQYPKTVTFYGSARLKEGNRYYDQARVLAQEICKLGFAVITGGGPGIMEAGNRGTSETCGYGVGFNIELPTEQLLNQYATHGVSFEYFFTRKAVMAFSAEVYLGFPGGFGTFDEIFELLTLIQTKKSPRIPVVLVGSEFWGPVDVLIKKIMRDEFKTINPEDTELYTILDDNDKILEIIKNAPHRDKYRELKTAQS